MLGTVIPTREVAKTLRTGQTTSYVDYDDAYYAALGLGVAKAYLVLSVEAQYTGTTNIDLAHYTSGAGAVTFSNVLKTIVDTGGGLAIFLTNDVIMTSSTLNPGPFTITTGGVAGTITCTGATFVAETPAGAVTFYKREAHSNICVLDLKTGLMWSQTVSGKMGAASDGKLPWTTVAGGYGIFPYCAAANAAGLAGFTDWRVANIQEIRLLLDWSLNPTDANLTAFPNGMQDSWCSTTTLFDITRSTHRYIGGGLSGDFARNAAKTENHTVLLVRGGGVL